MSTQGASGSPQPESKLLARAPWLGPMLSPLWHKPGAGLVISAGGDPKLGTLEGACLLPVRRAGDGTWSVDDTALLKVEREEVQAGREPQFFRRLSASEESDWFSWPLAPWVVRLRGPVTALLLYRQGPSMDVETSDRARGVIGRRYDNTQRMWQKTAKFAARLQEKFGKKPSDPPSASLAALARAWKDECRSAADEALKAMRRDDPLPLGMILLPPPATERSLRLALGSCQYPHGLLDQIPAADSWHRLNRRHFVPRWRRPELLVLTGDQVYVDATAGLLDALHSDERYRIPYENWLRTGEIKSTLRRMPLLTTLDDHEIDDNWEPVAPALPEPIDESEEPCETPLARRFRVNRSLRRMGVSSFLRYQRPLVAPDPRDPDGEPLWQTFEQGGVALFLLDTRSRRGHRRSVSGPDAELFDEPQLRALMRWMLRHRAQPKLIVSPSAIFPRQRRSVPADLLACARSAAAGDDRTELRSDGWSGFPLTWCRVLRFILRQRIPRVVFLSGDEHLGLVSDIALSDPSGRKASLLSIHAPGLYTPYAFANAAPSDLLLSETFSFNLRGRPAGGQAVSCTVRTQVVEGAGFVLVDLHCGPDGSWKLRARFDSDPASAPPDQRRVFKRVL